MLLTTPSSVELHVCNGEGGCGQPISDTVFKIGIISLAVMKSAPNSASAAEVMTNLIICSIVRTGTFHLGSGSLSDKNIWSPTRLRPLD